MPEHLTRLKSMRLQNERSIWIREPHTRSNARNLMVILDGELYRERVGAISIIDGLTTGKQIADSWFVFVSMESTEARWKECPCHPPFAEFITEELLPWLEIRHPEIGRIQERILVGLSYTGLAAAFIAKECPGVFRKVISQSGSFWWGDCWLIKAFEGANLHGSTEFYLDVGKQEIQENVLHREDVLQTVSQIEGVRRFRDALLRWGCPVTYVEFDGGHDFESWKKTLPAALAWALPA